MQPKKTGPTATFSFSVPKTHFFVVLYFNQLIFFFNFSKKTCCATYKHLAKMFLTSNNNNLLIKKQEIIYLIHPLICSYIINNTADMPKHLSQPMIKTYKICAASKDSDHPVHPPSMARVLIHLSLDSPEAVEGTCYQWRPWCTGWSESSLVEYHPSSMNKLFFIQCNNLFWTIHK